MSKTTTRRKQVCYHQSSNSSVAGRHNNYSDEYLQACHAKGGVRVSLPKKGWDSYICLEKEVVVDMGDLESQFVVHPKRD